MQVNNWPIYVALPCPWCRGKGYQTAYLVSTGHVACKECGIELPVEAWGTLSQAAELARAVDAINNHYHGFAVGFFEGADEWHAGWWPAIDTQAPCISSELRAALIALAKQVQDA